MRVRRLGLAGLALLTGASLLRTSMSLAFAPSAPRTNLNFRLSEAALQELSGEAPKPTIGRAPRPNRRAIETRVVALRFDTLLRYSRDVPMGETRILTQGTAGRALAAYRVTYRKGRVVSRTLLSYVLLASPLPRVLLRGSAAAALGSHIQYGQASWYDCTGTYAAHFSLPFGTVVTVTNLDNGETVTVVINDRGPYGIAYRIIDLCSTAFAQIAPLAQGVARVKITW